MLTAANMSFSLCPLLTQGAIHALELCGSEALKRAFLGRMIEGAWTGTMNLTEPQAGSDLALVRTKAVREGERYRITGQKIFITYGDHDIAENIVHLVLARTPDAPPGVKGISLFIVPKFLVNPDGTLGERNAVRCVSIEHKLGIHASPTAVMAFDDAEGYLVGEENKGLAYMFVMMNEARFSVGLEGLAVAERAFQRAVAYAKERLQGKDPVEGGKAVPIIRHPDVRRMLMLMKSQTEAMRALAYAVAAAMDFAQRAPGRGRAQTAPGLRRLHDPGGEGLVHRDRHRGRLARRAGARRHGLHRGDGRRAVSARCTDHLDLRGHHRHPVDRPRRPQGRARRRRHGAGRAVRVAMG